ncbi:MAG: hypothetical protein M1533_03335 [Candidatus Thermoplasmatota archaeon]|nr:hypothetical protein [Candidatus Thermoplasmatota archaeon]MCL5794072.1 hypothetical protein [Candidatus Thermoplasmatota archaeon]
MNKFLTFLGIAALALSSLSFVYSLYFPGVIMLIIGAVLLAREIRPLMASRRISDITYNSIIESGLARIQNGNTSIQKEQFEKVMSMIRDVLSAQQYVPEIGFDSVYLQYNSEVPASGALKIIQSRGIKADLMQDKSTWRIRIQF